MSKKQIILIGGGGHCKSCIDVIESGNEYIIAGIIDTEDKIGESILGYKIIGCDDDLKSLRQKYDYALITVGQIASASLKTKLFEKALNEGYILPKVISSSAHVSKHATIGRGTIVMHQVVVNANANIGDNCIINSKALIEHDCVIGNHTHISTAVVLNGGVCVGSHSFIGSGSVLRNGISLFNKVVVGMGSIVLKSINDSGMYLNNSKNI